MVSLTGKPPPLNPFNILPDELICEIMLYLKSDTQNLLNFASTCHRHLRLLQNLPKWPNGLHFHFKWREPQEEYCEYCDSRRRDPSHRPPCDLFKKAKPRTRSTTRQDSDSNESHCVESKCSCKSSLHLCFDDLLSRKWIKYNKITLPEGHYSYMTLRCLGRAFREALESDNRRLALDNIERMVELDTIYTTHNFIMNVLNHLTNVKYLTARFSYLAQMDSTSDENFVRRLECLSVYHCSWKCNNFGYGHNLVNYFRPRSFNINFALVPIHSKDFESISKKLRGKQENYSLSCFLQEYLDSIVGISWTACQLSAEELDKKAEKTNQIRFKFEDVQLIPWVEEAHQLYYPNYYSFGYRLDRLPAEKRKQDELLDLVNELCHIENQMLKIRWNPESRFSYFLQLCLDDVSDED